MRTEEGNDVLCTNVSDWYESALSYIKSARFQFALL
jgi:hypothetical protein